MCRLIFETVKWADGAPRLLPWHQARVERAMSLYGVAGAPVPDLEAVLASCPGPGSGIYKCHITYDTQGRVKAPVFAPYRPRRVKKLVCVEAPHLDYSCKWEDRDGTGGRGCGIGRG